VRLKILGKACVNIFPRLVLSGPSTIDPRAIKAAYFYFHSIFAILSDANCITYPTTSLPRSWAKAWRQQAAARECPHSSPSSSSSNLIMVKPFKMRVINFAPTY
jgi:hypothetical protein